MFDHADSESIVNQPANLLPNKEAPVEREAMLTFVEQAARVFFNAAGGSHAWDHTLRVFHLSRHIGVSEEADLDVVRIAAYLHDIGRPDQDASRGRICHAARGAELAGPIVDRLPLTVPQKENIIHCIRTHRFRNRHIPESLEARVLYDADKLDAIGAIGVARAFMFAGEVGARLHTPEVDLEHTRSYSENDTGYREYRIKLSKIAERMQTAAGRRLALERHRFMEAFFNQFLKEFEGKG